MRSEPEAAGYCKEGRAEAAIALLSRNHLKLASDYCRSRKSQPSNFPLVLKSILKTNRESQQTEEKVPGKPVKTVSFLLTYFYSKSEQLVDTFI